MASVFEIPAVNLMVGCGVCLCDELVYIRFADIPQRKNVVNVSFQIIGFMTLLLRMCVSRSALLWDSSLVPLHDKVCTGSLRTRDGISKLMSNVMLLVAL